MIRLGLARLSALPAWMTILCALVLWQSGPAFGFACSMSATAISFGNVDVTTGASSPSTSTLTLSCSGAPSNKYLRMCVDISGGSASDATSRMMNGSGSNKLRFQLYTDAAMTDPWGSWSGSLYGGGYTWDVYSTAANIEDSITVYGQVLGSQQTVAAGSYTSNLTLYFTYNDKNTTACPTSGKGNSTTTFAATASVIASCTVNAGTLNFGAVSWLTSNVDATASISATCTNGAPYSLGLSAGGGSGATVANRKMTYAAKTIGYSLYQDSSRSVVWGETVSTNTVSATGTGSQQSFTVYGRVPIQTTPPAGTYADAVVVTVTF